eukprot:jgi/Undpi1/12668/HiC_scaffold_6.g02336.m1
MATEEVTTEASLPEQRVTTMEEHLNNINNVDAPSHNDSTSDTCNLNNDNSDTRYHARGEERLFDSLLEELFFLDDATPQLERQLASRYISAMGGPAGWLDRPAGSIVAIIIRLASQHFSAMDAPEGWIVATTLVRQVYLVATNERYKAAEAEWDRLEKTMKEIKRKTMAMLFRKWHSVVSDKLDAVGRTDEVEIKGSKVTAADPTDEADGKKLKGETFAGT